LVILFVALPLPAACRQPVPEDKAARLASGSKAASYATAKNRSNFNVIFVRWCARRAFAFDV